MKQQDAPQPQSQALSPLPSLSLRLNNKEGKIERAWEWSLTRKDLAGPFLFLVSSIFFRLPALLGTVKDFVTTGWRLAAGFRGCRDFLDNENTIKSNVIPHELKSSWCDSRSLHRLKKVKSSSARRRLKSLIKFINTMPNPHKRHDNIHVCVMTWWHNHLCRGNVNINIKI